MLTVVAVRAAAALENVRILAGERLTSKRLRFVSRMNEMLLESSNAWSTMKAVASAIATEFADACAVIKLEGDGVRVEAAAARDPKGECGHRRVGRASVLCAPKVRTASRATPARAPIGSARGRLAGAHEGPHLAISRRANPGVKRARDDHRPVAFRQRRLWSPDGNLLRGDDRKPLDDIPT